uniref:peptidylprolyl isomerase n=1 Tax=Alexandrium andersonii TaxID=327968 RepID=A0A7S2H6S9_9DINO|mmetsp:Transcript_68289/g.153013  ORF Transcript_68289/g.153013 Transcript_68289/m.153013 type:complete len:137 (+) Transcript_68289:104-514(+)
MGVFRTFALFLLASQLGAASEVSVSLPEGVTKEILKAGDGVHYPRAGDTVTMHYTGTLTENGEKFDSSVDRGTPFKTQIGVGEVIRGWDEGVPTMSLGEKAVLKMTSDFGYGDQGAGGVIPPGADLTFEVQLLKIS